MECVNYNRKIQTFLSETYWIDILIDLTTTFRMDNIVS